MCAGNVLGPVIQNTAKHCLRSKSKSERLPTAALGQELFQIPSIVKGLIHHGLKPVSRLWPKEKKSKSYDETTFHTLPRFSYIHMVTKSSPSFLVTSSRPTN